jgi:hypothetical protein
MEMKRKGWIVWVWGKSGGLIVFLGIMAMMLTAYTFAAASEQADSANELARHLKNLMMDTYNSVGDMDVEFTLPSSLDGENFTIELFDKPGDRIGIIVKTFRGERELFGASSLALPLSNSSYLTIVQFNRTQQNLCVVKYGGKLHLQNSKCQ